MIVMKFGGTSLASPTSLRRVLSIIRSEAHRHPVIVASAMGHTTDSLLEVLAEARRASSYKSWKAQEAIKSHHFAICEEVLQGEQLRTIEEFLRVTFRDLHVRMLELCEGERAYSPELQDWTLSLGEQLSSRLLAAILQEHCRETIHLDARKLILTDATFTNAQPAYWESYARLRWAIPATRDDKLFVLGGFMGADPDGRTTTLGRGGSDLTASIVGAALNAEAIQVWKDVDGMMSCDPRILARGYQVKALSYQEASELAKAGATILHPETMVPAERLRIPLVIRNTFCPDRPGTIIHHRADLQTNDVKSIAIKRGMTVLEVRAADQTKNLSALIQFCQEHRQTTSIIGSSENLVYVAIDENVKAPESVLAFGGCLEVKVRSKQAVLTLVGQNLNKDAVTSKLSTILRGTPAFLIPGDSLHSQTLTVAETQLQQCIGLLHQSFFAHPDPNIFVADKPGKVDQDAGLTETLQRQLETRRRSFVLSPGLLQTN